MRSLPAAALALSLLLVLCAALSSGFKHKLKARLNVNVAKEPKAVTYTTPKSKVRGMSSRLKSRDKAETYFSTQEALL